MYTFCYWLIYYSFTFQDGVIALECKTAIEASARILKQHQINSPKFFSPLSSNEAVSLDFQMAGFTPSELALLRNRSSYLRYKCDQCLKAPIVDVRYRCLDEACKDFDLCEDCHTNAAHIYQSPESMSTHDSSHIMQRLIVPPLDPELEHLTARQILDRLLHPEARQNSQSGQAGEREISSSHETETKTKTETETETETEAISKTVGTN